MSGGQFTEVVGYGVRSAREEQPVPVAGPLALRVRAFLVLGHAGSGVGCVALAVHVARVALASAAAPATLPWYALVAWTLWGAMLLVAGLESLAAAWTYTTRPLLRVAGDRLRWRRVPPARACDVGADELVWRPRAGFVGRYLLTRGDAGRRRIPIWLLSRADQRRLFGWLDANVPPSR